MVVENNEYEGKYLILEKRLKVIEWHKIFSLDAIDMYLVPNVTLPSIFKVPNFKKYKGLSCPKGHLIMYCRKMTSHSCNDKLIIHCFQDSLSEASLKCYVNLERGHIQSWKDLV